MLLGSLLEGYFYSLFMKACTDRFLSVLRKAVYSSLSLHLAFINWLLLIGNYYTFGGTALSSFDFYPKIVLRSSSGVVTGAML